jgi:glycosyltransferase involved in cell wall biosynthesis
LARNIAGVVRVKIAINALLYSIGADYRQTGISRYVDRLLGCVAAELPGDDVTALVSQGAEPDWSGVDLMQAHVPSGSPLRRIAWEQAALPALIRKGSFDIYHGSVNTLPLIPTGTRRIVTIHDLAFLRFPEQVTRKRYAYLKSMVGNSARRADAILVPSEATASDVHDLLGASRNRIHITPLGVDAHFRPAPPEAIQAIRSSYGLDQPYVLTVGTIEPRKNLRRLIEAFALGASQHDCDLVLVGPTGWLTDGIEQAIVQSELGDRIKRTGFVNDDGLVGLYSGAEVVVIPSLYEGFGLPVLEAMACGAVVVTSNVSSMPEVAGEAAILVDPVDTQSIASGIRLALEDKMLRKRLESAAVVRARDFTWKRTARTTADAYRSMVS